MTLHVVCRDGGDFFSVCVEFGVSVIGCNDVENDNAWGDAF